MKYMLSYIYLLIWVLILIYIPVFENVHIKYDIFTPLFALEEYRKAKISIKMWEKRWERW